MPSFKFSFSRVDLVLRQPFTIARGTKATVTNVFLELTADGVTGYGEAGPNIRYNEDADAVCRFLSKLPDDFFDEVTTISGLSKKLDAFAASQGPAIYSAQAAIETAWLDWWGKKHEQAIWKLWEADTPTGPVTSYTIGLDEIDVMQEKVKAASQYPIYKVKLGTDRDREIITALREVTDNPIRVDANEGWRSLDQAKEMVDFLAEHNIELVEQPMPADRLDDIVTLKSYAAIPLCADESFTGQENLEEIAAAFDMINIKLMKTGSLFKAMAHIEQARAHNMEVMIGCMIESSIGNTAGALLSLWADQADLDGHLLIKDDPAAGLTLSPDKQVVIPNVPGLGLRWG